MSSDRRLVYDKRLNDRHSVTLQPSPPWRLRHFFSAPRTPFRPCVRIF